MLAYLESSTHLIRRHVGLCYWMMREETKETSVEWYSLRPKIIVQFTILFRPIYIVQLLLSRV